MNDRDGRPGQDPPVDSRYVEARRVLLDALTALAPHGAAFIVAGAQAVYLHTGDADLAVAPFTTDADLALDPTRLDDEPQLEASMSAAGFHLLPVGDHVEPGVWVTPAEIEGVEVDVPVDLIVPEGAAAGGGRRGARLGPHGKRAARRAVGLEAALVDHSTMRISALDPADGRSVEAEVAGPAALLVAKAHKLHDRLGSGKTDRLDDKDAGDCVRLMQTTSAEAIGSTFARLRDDPIAGPPSTAALAYMDELFGRRGRPGIAMAARALRVGMANEAVEVISTAYTRRVLASAVPHR